MTKTVSLASLDARKASDEAFDLEYILPDGSGSGIILQVLGSHSDAVSGEVNRLINERRRKEAVSAARSSKARPDSVEVTSVEDDIAFSQRLAAVRLVGWKGITEPWTPELALQLCQRNPDVAAQVLEASGDLGNFMKLPSKGS